MVPSFRHITPALRTFCSDNALQALPKELERVGSERAVIFCSPSIRRHAAAFDRVTNALGARLVHVFEDVAPHSPLPVVEAGRDALRRHDADAVVAVGGGSAIVTARAASILLAEDKPADELCTRRGADGRMTSPRLHAPKLSQWVVPSTPTTAYAKAGSAVRDPATGERLALFDPKTRAQGIFLDPELALTAPVGLTEGSALNALAMAVEGLQSSFDDPLAEALLTHGLQMLARWLPRLRATPDDAEPRLRLMVGALLSGQGTDHAGGGLAQALSHAAGPMSSTSNGVLEALLLPHTVRFNAPATAPGLARVVATLDGGAASADADSAVAAIERTLQATNVPTRLRDVGITQEHLPDVVAHALDDWWLTRSPRAVGADDLRALLDAAW